MALLAELICFWGAMGLALLPGLRGSLSHSLSYSCLPEPSQGLPQFLSRVCLDNQPIARYDTHARKVELLVPWKEELQKAHPSHWKKETERVQATVEAFRAELERMRRGNPQNGGLHISQAILGCELREDGSQGGYLHFGYDGRDVLSFQMGTLTWVADEAHAQAFKREWDANLEESTEVYLEETCIEQLQRYLAYGKGDLQRTEPPVGTVTREAISDSVEALICQAYGFYPKEIKTTWMRDGEACEYETLHRNVAPNSDGTYYVWLSIEINPKERDRYSCLVEHSGSLEPLVLAWKEEAATRQRHILVGTVPAVLLVLLMFLLLGWWWKSRGNLHPGGTSFSDPVSSERLPSVEIEIPETHRPGAASEAVHLQEPSPQASTSSTSSNPDDAWKPFLRLCGLLRTWRRKTSVV